MYPSVLLVDDNAEVLGITLDLLQAAEMNVIAACGAMEAIRIFELKRYDIGLLVADLMMPQMGGTELAQILRQKHPELPVLYTSGYSDPPFELDENSGFIAKPYNPSQLIALARSLMSRHVH